MIYFCIGYKKEMISKKRMEDMKDEERVHKQLREINEEIEKER